MTMKSSILVRMISYTEKESKLRTPETVCVRMYVNWRINLFNLTVYEDRGKGSKSKYSQIQPNEDSEKKLKSMHIKSRATWQ